MRKEEEVWVKYKSKDVTCHLVDLMIEQVFIKLSAWLLGETLQGASWHIACLTRRWIHTLAVCIAHAQSLTVKHSKLPFNNIGQKRQVKFTFPVLKPLGSKFYEVMSARYQLNGSRFPNPGPGMSFLQLYRRASHFEAERVQAKR